MSYSVTRLENEPIIVVTYTDPFIPVEDIPGAHYETSELLRYMPGTIYRVIDARIPKGSLDSLVETLYLSSRGKAGGTADPRIRSILVGTSEIVQRFAEAMKQKQ